MKIYAGPARKVVPTRKFCKKKTLSLMCATGIVGKKRDPRIQDPGPFFGQN